MEGMANIFGLCVYCGIMLLCAILVISGFLRWISDSKTRDKRLDILSKIAFVILFFKLFKYYIKYSVEQYGDENGMLIFKLVSWNQSGDESIDPSMLAERYQEIIKTVIGSLIFFIVFISAAALLFIVIHCIYTGLKTMIRRNAETKSLNSESAKVEESVEEFFDVVKKREVRLLMALGILAFLFILPILVGKQDIGDPISTFMNGVETICCAFAGNDGAGANDNELIRYILIYIIVIGVIFAVIKLLYVILDRMMQGHKDANLIDRYSSPIGLLAVGVAFLLALQNGNLFNETDSKENYAEIIMELLKAFGTVVFITAITILTLEIVRLLMDIQQKIIHQEAKYLFIALVGQSALLVLEAMKFIYSGVCGMIGVSGSTDMMEIEKELEKKIVKRMKRQIDSADVDIDDVGEHGIDFSVFSEKVTKK